MEAITEFDGKRLTIMEEGRTLTGGRANIKPPALAYTQITIERHDNDAVSFSVQDNITDVDGHWSPITLTNSQFEGFKKAMSEI